MGKAKRLRKMKSARKMARKMSRSTCSAMAHVFIVQLEAMRLAINTRNLATNTCNGGFLERKDPIKLPEGGSEIVINIPKFVADKEASKKLADKIIDSLRG